MSTDFDFESRLVSLLLAYGRHRGVDLTAWAERLRVPEDVRTEAPGKSLLVTPISGLVGLADELARATGDVHLGLSLAAWVPRGSYGVAEFLMRAGPTMRDVLDNLVRFSGLVTPSQSFRVEAADDEVLVRHGPAVRPSALGRHLTEYSSAILASTARQLLGAPPRRAWFVHPRAEGTDFARYVEALGTAQLEWSASDSGFSIDRAQLDVRIEGGDAALSTFLEDLAQQAMALRPKSDDLIESVRAKVRDAIRHGEPTVDRVAAVLGLSARTLQRRLGDASTSFQQVLDDVRFDLARTYLKDPRFDPTQVAFLLGYSELRAFDRAFRRWAGVAPAAWKP